jgi:hypothetical protein
MASKIDGTAIAKSIRAGLKAEIEEAQLTNPRFKPNLVIFQGKLLVQWSRDETAVTRANQYSDVQLETGLIPVSSAKSDNQVNQNYELTCPRHLRAHETEGRSRGEIAPPPDEALPISLLIPVPS